ncbi:MAG: sigma 54-interacting transcriptional regulator [Nitrospirota bacterium]
MKKLRVKISDNLDFIQQILNSKANDLIEIVSNEHDLLITENIPDGSQLFVVIWDKHDISEIEKKIMSFKNTRYKYLRGFFLKNDIKFNPETFIETIIEIKKEVNFRDELYQKAHDIESKREYISIGSLVNVKKGTKGGFEDMYGQPRFTTLFIDKPMLKLMSNLSRILEEIKPSIVIMDKDYRDIINKIIETGGINKEKEEFDENLIKGLQEKQSTSPALIQPILLTGETGVGKTLIARWIHEKICEFYEDKKYSGSFQEVNSSGLSPNLLESELFGHVKGAWTDARTVKPGRALLALGGVLFLDEIGDMHLDVQPKVMKFIEEKTFMPEGWPGINPFYTPLLVVAATNKNLDEEIEKGTFRKDFYTRFKHRIHVPSIEERKGSLNVIIDLILQSYGAKKKGLDYVSNEAIEKFKQIKYEDNFRGLERMVRDAAYRTLEFKLDIILPEIVEEVSKNI